MKLRIGCSGWQYPEWENLFYKKKISKKQWFQYYAAHFNTVEINYSYYRFPSEKTILRWREQAPPNFSYSLKVNKGIIRKRLKGTQRMLSDFYALAELLGPTLDRLVFQWPATLQYDPELLERLVEQLDPKKNNVTEFRHPSWWRDDVIQTLNKANIIFCSVSAPALPDKIINCNGQAYLRFHGQHRWFHGSYSQTTLQHWVDEIKKCGIKKLWAYFNNTASASAPGNALLLNQLLKE